MQKISVDRKMKIIVNKNNAMFTFLQLSSFGWQENKNHNGLLIHTTPASFTMVGMGRFSKKTLPDITENLKFASAYIDISIHCHDFFQTSTTYPSN